MKKSKRCLFSITITRAGGCYFWVIKHSHNLFSISITPRAFDGQADWESDVAMDPAEA